MRNKIFIFIIGLLVGAIITTIGFYIYSKNNCNNNGGMPNGAPPEMMQNGNNGGMPNGTPPEKPDGENKGELPNSTTEITQDSSDSSSNV